ncbi:UNVERIFIED_CONTAM: YfcO family protein, partial [Salmonella enterica subsp. enterica serovar Enteritidis]
VPVATFVISWDANVSKQKTTLMHDATGGTEKRTLHTYLMEGWKLCDGSKFDNRGAYCRFVSSGITLNVMGCDKSSVTTRAVDHPI